MILERRKIIQITAVAVNTSPGGASHPILFGLADDGTVWQSQQASTGWTSYPSDLPKRQVFAPAPPHGHPMRTIHDEPKQGA